MLCYFLLYSKGNFTYIDTHTHTHTHTHTGEGNGTPLQYSCLENPMDGGACQAAVHWVTKSQRRLSDFTFTFYFLALEKKMATHSSVLAWRIPWIGEPVGLPSMGSHRVDMTEVTQQQQSLTDSLTESPDFKYCYSYLLEPLWNMLRI